MPIGIQARAKSVLGGPLGKRLGSTIPLSRETLEKIGEILVASIVREAKRDFAIQGKVPRAPVGIPNSVSFFDSFSYRIRGKSTIDIVSTWPFLEQITEGRKPYPMRWLTRQKNVRTVPMIQEDGTVLFRSTPLTTDKAWIHPGFAKHTFIQRGIKKAKAAIVDAMRADIIAALNGGGR